MRCLNMKKLIKPSLSKKTALSSDITEKLIVENVEKNIELLKELFRDCSDIIYRSIFAGEKKAYLLFLDGLVDSGSIQLHAIKQMLDEVDTHDLNAEFVMGKVISLSSVKETDKIDDVVAGVLKGNTLLIIDGVSSAFVFDAKGGQRRSVAEPESESAVRGPREGFTESLRVNTALIRHKIRSNRLKILSKEIGEETTTGIAIVYIEGIAALNL